MSFLSLLAPCLILLILRLGNLVLMLQCTMVNFVPFSVQEVHKAQKNIDPKSTRVLIEPYILKLASDFIAKLLTYIFNLLVETNVVPRLWKYAFVLPLVKKGDPTYLNNNRPISNFSMLPKILEALVSDQLKEYLLNNDIFIYISVRV